MKRQDPLKSLDVHEWMANDRRLLAASMDDPDTHISKHLAWARVYLNRHCTWGGAASWPCPSADHQ
jgi:hypothetical protein